MIPPHPNLGLTAGSAAVVATPGRARGTGLRALRAWRQCRARGASEEERVRALEERDTA